MCRAPENEPLNAFQQGVLALVTAVEGLNLIDLHKTVHEKLIDVVKSIESEGQIP